MTRAEILLQLAAQIAKTRGELGAMEEEFYRLVGDDPKSGAQPHAHRKVLAPPAAGGRAPQISGSIADRIKAFAAEFNRAHLGESFGLPELFDSMPDADQKSIRGTLGRLSKEKDGIEWFARGRYKYHAPQGGAGGE